MPQIGMPDDLCSASHVPEEYRNQISQSQWKWLLRHRQRNGLDSAIIKLGPRIFLLSKSAFRDWLESRLN